MLRHYISSVSGEHIKSQKLAQKVGFTTSQVLPEVELAENEYFAMLDGDGKVQYWPDDTECTWQVKTRFEKVTAYSIETKEPKQFEDKTLVTDDYTLKQSPTSYHTWNAEQSDWELTATAAAEQLADTLKASKASIDNTSSAIAQQWTRFSEEYLEREAQALAFKQAGYTGECGNYVTMYSTRANKTEQEATDIILQQADGLRALQEQLASERMRKYELDACETVEAITVLTTEICNNLKAIGDSYE
ncbi:hypothetical protein K6U17_14885 [Vibrio fluvialis]|uniref:hypothetical protein n=1 Tax=Vibrio fluvialis TaxID=676 RepID=UPI001EEAFD01|nr:hypothetical protein [Vibrio fluvialis]MCG6410505.1 hypothetical protein [Vibrio fluvialis]